MRTPQPSHTLNRESMSISGLKTYAHFSSPFELEAFGPDPSSSMSVQ